MPSIIEGYNYDIFISYRQKDNKGDRWVSEFVEALKTELESTFKEEISVYFDINPHDGLLETHDVDASLKEKLKCLIFIPIISRTYCDPKSFAWEHEFKAFVEQASKDQFGLKVKLPSGNVANRMIPVQIHDLYPEDKTIIEKELGGVLRAIEFIYKEPGVNRPLTSGDDEKLNLNKTKYRNQINKVANAIDEIIHSLKEVHPEVVKEKVQRKELLSEPRQVEERRELERPIKLKRWKKLTGIIVAVVLLLMAVIFTYPKVFKKNTIEKLRSSGERISVAVMPFQNMTNDTIWNVWQIGIQDALINALSNSEELMVRQTESINNILQSKGLTNYASITPSIASSISQKLDAIVFIHGSIKQMASTLRLNAQLIDSKTEEVFKSFQIDGTVNMILPIIDSLSMMVKNFLIISKLKKEITPELQPLASTNSPEAYRSLILGTNAFAKSDWPKAREFYLQAIEIDSNYIPAIVQLSWAYANQGLNKEGKKYCKRAYEKREQGTLYMKIWIDYLHAYFYETPQEMIKCYTQLLDLDDQSPITYTELGWNYNRLFQYDKAIPKFEKALEIYNKWGSKPFWSNYNYTLLGFAYHKTGMYKKEKELYKKAEQDIPDDPELISRQSILSLNEGDTLSANDYIKKYISVRKENSVPEASIINDVASIYSDAGVLDKAEEYYRNALSLEPDNPWRLNNLAWFLIDGDRNIYEGMGLIDKAIASTPDNYDFLNTKGWGLYKQRKYKEALDILQKSWDLRMKNDIYSHEAYLHLEALKKAVASQKNN